MPYATFQPNSGSMSKSDEVTLHEAIHAYTAEGAWVEFMEDRKGLLKPGYLADVVMLSADIEAAAPDKVATMKPLLTICDGRVTFEAA